LGKLPNGQSEEEREKGGVPEWGDWRKGRWPDIEIGWVLGRPIDTGKGTGGHQKSSPYKKKD